MNKACVIGTAVLLLGLNTWSGAEVEGGTQYVPDKASRSESEAELFGTNDAIWNDYIRLIEGYPMRIAIHDRSKVLIGLSPKLKSMFEDAADDNEHYGYTNIQIDSNSTLRVKIDFSNCAVDALKTHLPSSLFRFRGANRPNTVYGVDTLPVPNASFVAHFDGYDSLSYCYYNITVFVTRITGRLVDRDTYLSVTRRINSLFDSDYEALANSSDIEFVKAKDEDLKLFLKSYSKTDNSAIIGWSVANDSLKDHWLRADTLDGRIRIENKDEQTLKVSDMPEDGTTVSLFAISPDTKKWYAVQFDIQ